MPPIVPLRNDLEKVLDVDRDLIGYSDSKFVFTDITFGVSDKVISFLIKLPYYVIFKLQNMYYYSIIVLFYRVVLW